jgi:hypothetical protein
MTETDNEGGSISVSGAGAAGGAILRPYAARGERSTSQLYSSSSFDPYSELLGTPREVDSLMNLNPPVLGSGYISRTDSSQVSSNQPSYPNLPATIEPGTPLEASPLHQEEPSTPQEESRQDQFPQVGTIEPSSTPQETSPLRQDQSPSPREPSPPPQESSPPPEEQSPPPPQ